MKQKSGPLSAAVPSLQKGFTLVELLLTIGIVAVLAVAVIITLNPGELLRQSRDSSRISDMSTLKTAITTYITDGGGKAPIGAADTCYAHASSTLTDCSTRFAGGGTPALSDSANIDGTGWIPIDFTAMSNNSPIYTLPVDPINNATYFYAYKADPIQMHFEVNAKMESARYANGGDGDVESTDGGDNPNLLESGSALNL